MPDTLDYICEESFESREKNIRAQDGINSFGLYYRVSRLSDGAALEDTIWPLENKRLATKSDYGTIPDLRSRGVPWEDIFQAAMEAAQGVKPVVKAYR